LAREANVRWDKNAGAWRSDVGPRGRNGRRTPVYFSRDEVGAEVAQSKAGERAARKLLEKYIERRDEQDAAGTRGLAEPTVEQLRLHWLSHVKRKGTPEAYEVSRSGIGQFAAFAQRGVAYRDRLASKLTATDLERFLESKRAAGRKPSYRMPSPGARRAIVGYARWPGR
jgi:hypothetical protein